MGQKKIKKEKSSGGFFDISEDISKDENPGEYPGTVREPEGSDGGGGGAAFREKKLLTASGNTASDMGKSGQAKFRRGAVIFVAGLLCLLIVLKLISGLDFVKDSDYIPKDWLSGNSDSGLNTRLEFYPADWETDIFSFDEYLELQPEKIYYSDDGGTMYESLSPDELYRFGGHGLVFVNEYLNAVKRADIETLNSMFTENYFDRFDPYTEKFPMQKIFDIRITRYIYSDPELDSAAYDDYYYIVSYKIFRNDGLFRDDIDEYSSMPQLIEVLIDTNGNGKIDNIIDLPGYTQ